MMASQRVFAEEEKSCVEEFLKNECDVISATTSQVELARAEDKKRKAYNTMMQNKQRCVHQLAKYEQSKKEYVAAAQMLKRLKANQVNVGTPENMDLR